MSAATVVTLRQRQGQREIQPLEGSPFSQTADFERQSSEGTATSSSKQSSTKVEARRKAYLKAYHRSRWHLHDTEADVGEIEPRRSSVRMTLRKDDTMKVCALCRDTLRSVLSSTRFEVVMGVVILANAASIGMEQTDRIAGQQYTEICSTLDEVFLLIYTVELAARFIAFGRAVVEDGWILFDFFLVLVGIVTQWILPLVLGSLDEAGLFMVLRSARLLRLAKTVRLLIRFKELWMLVQGLLSSAYTMLYTLLLLVVILYIFACLGMELVFEHPSAVGASADLDFARVVQDKFSSLPVAMLSLVQFVCLDNVSLIYVPLAKQDPLLCIYFLALILVVGIVVMNLVTAVIVNSAMEQTAKDKHLLKVVEDDNRKQLLRSLRDLFLRLDEDNSGDVSRQELLDIGVDELRMLRQLTGRDSPVDIFDALDLDGSDTIGIDEFCDGLWEVAISQTPIEIKRMEKQLQILLDLVHGQASDQEIMHAKLCHLHDIVAKNAPGESGSSRAAPGDGELRHFECSQVSVPSLEDLEQQFTTQASSIHSKRRSDGIADPAAKHMELQATALVDFKGAADVSLAGPGDVKPEHVEQQVTSLVEHLMRTSTIAFAAAAEAQQLETCLLHSFFKATAVAVLPPLLDELGKLSALSTCAAAPDSELKSHCINGPNECLGIQAFTNQVAKSVRVWSLDERRSRDFEFRAESSTEPGVRLQRDTTASSAGFASRDIEYSMRV